MTVDWGMLKTEINTDPKSLGIAFDPQENEINNKFIADKLNEVGASSETISDSNALSVDTIISNCVKTEIDALTTKQSTLFSGLISRETITPNKIDPLIKAIFASGTTTRSNLVALANKSATRGEILFGENIIISTHDVHMARRQP